MKLPADGSGQANERALPLKQPASTKGWHIELVLRRIPRNQTSKNQRAQARWAGEGCQFNLLVLMHQRSPSPPYGVWVTHRDLRHIL